jgi:hypothetical protein
MRTIRRFSQVLLTLIGASLVMLAVYRFEGLYERVLVAALGLIVMELGIWQVTNAFFPNQREYKPLRKETDYFLALVRRLNHAAVAAQRGSSTALDDMDRLQSEMHHSIGRMRRLAGYTTEELGALTDASTLPTPMTAPAAMQNAASGR